MNAKTLLALCILALVVASSDAISYALTSTLPTKAFAEAVGWAAYTPGGRGGRLLRVTNLQASGPGSFAEAVGAQGPRIIVFEVGGVIDLGGRSIRIAEPFVTIAGQTAPSPGITFIRGGIGIQTHDVIVRHIRVRPGEAGRAKNSGWEVDAISTTGAHNVIVDHCSCTWATDENLSASGPRFEGQDVEQWRRGTSRTITFSNCIIAEGLSRSTHAKGEHSKGSLIHDNCTEIALVGNLYAHNRDRNPLFKGGARGAVVNNYIYNPGTRAMHYALVPTEWGERSYATGQMVIVGNVLEPGPSTSGTISFFRHHRGGPSEVFLSDNLTVGALGVVPLVEIDPRAEPGECRVLRLQPFWPPELTALPAAQIKQDVLAHAGARPWDRDAVDRRIVAEALSGQGQIIDSEQEVGGYPQVEPTYAPFDPSQWDLDDMTRRSRGAKKSEIRNPKSETSSNIQISRHAIATGAKQSPGTRSENVYEKWHGHPARGVSWHRHPADDPGAGSPCHVEPALHTPSEIALSLRFSQGHERGFRAASAFWSLGFWSFEFVSDFGFRIWDFCAARLQISRLRSYPAWARPAVILKLGHGLDVSHPVHKGMVFMAEKVHEKSGGRMRVEIFPNEQLGNEKECIEALQLGYLAMTKTSSAPMEGFVPQMRVFGIPYLFRDAEHFWKVCNGPSGKKLLLAGESKRLRGLCYYDAGARSFYAKRPIEKPADLTGLKIRVQNSIMSIKMVQAMGGSPTPIPWGELYTALDQGVVDGAENNAPSFRTSRHYEVCGYYSLDEHTRLPDVLVISTRVWNHLTPEQQRILQEAVDESVAYQRQLWAEAEEADLKTVQEAGAKIVRPDLAPFRASVQTVWKEFEGTEIGDLIRQIQEVQ